RRRRGPGGRAVPRRVLRVGAGLRRATPGRGRGRGDAAPQRGLSPDSAARLPRGPPRAATGGPGGGGVLCQGILRPHARRRPGGGRPQRLAEIAGATGTAMSEKWDEYNRYVKLWRASGDTERLRMASLCN